MTHRTTLGTTTSLVFTAAALAAAVGTASAFSGGTDGTTLVGEIDATVIPATSAANFATYQSGWRLVAFDRLPGSPNKWAGAGVESTGPFAATCSFFDAIAPSDLVTETDSNDLMVTDIDFHYANGQWVYSALCEPNNGDPDSGFGASHEASTVQNYFNNPGRFVMDVQPYNEAGSTQFALCWRTATPEDAAKQQQFFPALTAAQIQSKIDNEGLRLVDINARPHDALFSVIMELDDEPKDWWLHAVSFTEIQRFAAQYGARVVDLDAYGDPANPTYEALLRPSTNQLTQDTNTLMRNTTDGESGFNQSIGHVQQAGIRTDAYFEPADAFSLFYLYAAFEEIESGQASLNSLVTIRGGDGDSCPDDSGTFQITQYREALRRMMQDGDRQAAHTVLQKVGGTDIQNNLNDRNAIHSYLFHELGCYDGNIQNYTTLDDVDYLGRHYILGWLDDETEHAMLDLMNNNLSTTLAGSVTFQSVLDLALDQSDMTPWDKLRFKKYVFVQTVAGTYDNYASPSEGANTSRFVLHKMPVKIDPSIYGVDVGLYFGTANAFVNDASSTFNAETAVGLAIAKLWRNALNSVIPSWEASPTPCPADQNGDGFLDNGDIGTFLELFLQGDEQADINYDGVNDYGDLFMFIDLFTHGCSY